MPELKLFIIACEASADLHGAELIQELKRMCQNIQIQGLGGPLMKASGFDLLSDMTQISALGLGDVLRQYGTYRKIFYQALEKVKSSHPHAVVLIDSPAFNLRFAKKVRNLYPSLPIYYYICPQIWAWGHQRIAVVKQNITKMFSILPFETLFYQQAKVPCEFVGHPLLDHEKHESLDKNKMRQALNLPTNKILMGLLPGSRKKEVQRILPIMLQSAVLIQKSLPNSIFYVGKSTGIDTRIYDEILRSCPLKPICFSEQFNHHVLAMDFALVTSGTATLQTALVNTPFVLLYKAGLLTYLLGKQLIRVPYLGLVNLLADKPLVPEFIQYKAKPHDIAKEVLNILNTPEHYQKMQDEFLKIRGKLGQKGASKTTAKLILQDLGFLDAGRQTQVGLSVDNSRA